MAKGFAYIYTEEDYLNKVINKKFDVLFKELDDLLKPNVFQRFFTWLSCSIEKVKSYRISFKIVSRMFFEYPTCM